MSNVKHFVCREDILAKKKTIYDENEQPHLVVEVDDIMKLGPLIKISEDDYRKWFDYTLSRLTICGGKDEWNGS